MRPFNLAFIDTLHFNEVGLIPAIAQDWIDGAILMVAWMNRTALKCTLDSGEVHYWSRSRSSLWRKGEMSGHTQILHSIRHDCDADVLLLSVEQTGDIACHTGRRSCFFQKCGDDNEEKFTAAVLPPADACTELHRLIERRKCHPKNGSYTNRLFDNGENHILKKIGEESAEFVMACKDNDTVSIANEAADLVFHLQVALVHYDVSWRDVQSVLVSRRGKSTKLS